MRSSIIIIMQAAEAFYKTNSYQDCQVLCDHVRDCGAWTWVGSKYSQHRECRLKYRTGYTVLNAIGYYSGYRDQKPFVANDKQALDGDINLNCPEVMYSTNSYQDCQVLCDHTRGCEVWTWIGSSNYYQYRHCRLKHGNGYTVTNRSGHYSGFRNQGPYVAVGIAADNADLPC